MGSLSFNSITQASTTVALDSIANIQDWAVWSAAATPPTVTDKRSGGGSTIAVTTFGANTGYTGYSGAAEVRQIGWTNGTNTGTSNFTSCQYGNNGTNVNAGFTFTLPASTTSRRAYIYCGPYNCIGGVSASLSDGSATSISNTTSMTGGAGGSIIDSTIVIDYAANSAGQTLTVNIFYASAGGFSGGFMTFQGVAVATAASGTAYTLTVVKANVPVVGETVNFIYSGATHNYTLPVGTALVPILMAPAFADYALGISALSVPMVGKTVNFVYSPAGHNAYVLPISMLAVPVVGQTVNLVYGHPLPGITCAGGSFDSLTPMPGLML